MTDETTEQKEKRLKTLLEIVKLTKDGYAGTLPDGNIVDRRDFPDAIPVQENPLFGAPKPKPIKKHTLKGNTETREVWLDGELLDPKESQKYHNHSPDGFAWGYGGSAPSQLALAIMLKLTGKADGYMDFKFKIIAALPMNEDFEKDFYL